MEQATAECSSEPKILSIQNLAFDRIPHESQFFLDYLNNAPALVAFYPEKINSHVEIARRSSIVLQNYTTDRSKLAEALLEINERWGASAQTRANIELLREKETVAIVANALPQLFGGSLSTIYKTLSVLKATACLKSRGIKTVPVLWIDATNENFLDLTKTFVLARDGKISEIRTEQIDLNSATENAVLGETIEQAFEALFQKLPKNEFSKYWQSVLREAYQPGFSFNESFAGLMMRLFGEFGLILIDSRNENLKKLAEPIYSEIVNNSVEISAAINSRNKQLIKAGYQNESLTEENPFSFSLINDNEQIALKLDENFVKSQNAAKNQQFDIFESDELTRREDGARLMRIAAVRTVIADFLLPTVARYGDAAEITRFAQTSEIYRILKRPTPPILPRASVTIVDAKTNRTLNKYNLDITDFFQKPEVLRNQIFKQFLAPDAAQVFVDVENKVNRVLDRLSQELASVDRLLSIDLEKRREKILWHIAALKNKFERAESNQKEIINRRLEAAFAVLFPNGQLQEQLLNSMSLFARYGNNLTKWLMDSIDIDGHHHQIIEL